MERGGASHPRVFSGSQESFLPFSVSCILPVTKDCLSICCFSKDSRLLPDRLSPALPSAMTQAGLNFTVTPEDELQ